VEELKAIPKGTWGLGVSIILGLVCLIGGSELLVVGGVEIARKFGVSEAVIGLTVLAFGTSLPELAASVVAAIRKHADLALGNVLGSNIFNIVGILGIITVVKPLQVPSRVTNFDMWVMIFATLIFLYLVIWRNMVIPRFVAVAFLVIYFAYIVIIGNGVSSFW
jgi:cation:H+ antiporter